MWIRIKLRPQQPRAQENRRETNPFRSIEKVCRFRLCTIQLEKDDQELCD